MAQAPRDANQVPTLLAVNDVTGGTQPLLVDADGNLLIAASVVGGGVTGPVTSTVGALALWGDATGDTLTDSTVKLVTTVFSPTVSDGNSLGSATLMWSDLFLASGSVINWNNGDLTLTHAADTLTLAGGSLVLPAAGLTVGASIPFSDAAGVLTLQNVDALDATTEATIEAAIDTLANLTSIQGNTITVSGASTINQNVSTTGSPTFGGVTVGTAAGGFVFAGTKTYNAKLGVNTASQAITAGNSAARQVLLGGTFTEAASGNHPLIANLAIEISTVTGGVGTVSNTASLYIEGAMSATVSGANYALWVDAGTTQLDGDVNVGGTLTLTTDLSVANGGTGASSLTAYAVLCGGTTSTNPVQAIASVGTSGQVLTSNGAGALPTFQDAAGGGSLEAAADTMFLTGYIGGMFDTSSTNAQMTSAVAGSGANTFRLTQTRLGQIDVADSGGTIEGVLWEDVNTAGGGTNFWDLDQVLIGNFALESTTNQDCYFGLGVGEVGSGLVTPNATSTTRHIGFYVQDGTLYASNANGTTQTRTDITSGVTLTNYNTYKIVLDAGTDIEFWVNNVLKATHSTNMPTTDSGQGFAAGCTARGTDNTKGMILSRYCYHAIKAGVVA